jgi:hypothetical protein
MEGDDLRGSVVLLLVLNEKIHFWILCVLFPSFDFNFNLDLRIEVSVSSGRWFFPVFRLCSYLAR